MGLVDDSPQFLRAELAGADVGGQRDHAAGRHDLHQVRAAVRAFPHRAAQLIDTAGGAANHGAMAALTDDWWAGGNRRRAAWPLPVDNSLLLVAEVADCCHARGELRRMAN